jgi:hydrogenase-4 membrane subunit HyfE
MFSREKPGWEQEEERFIHRYFGPLVPIIGIAVFAVLHLDLPLGVGFALLVLVAACGVYLSGLLAVAFWRRRRLRMAGRGTARQG